MENIISWWYSFCKSDHKVGEGIPGGEPHHHTLAAARHLGCLLWPPLLPDRRQKDVRPAASSVHKPSCNAGERERAVKCEDLNDSSTPYKLEIMMKTIKNWKYHFLVVFIGKPGLVLARGQTCQWIPPRSVWYIKQRVFTFQNKYQWKMVSFCFIFNIRKSILCCIFSKF